MLCRPASGDRAVGLVRTLWFRALDHSSGVTVFVILKVFVLYRGASHASQPETGGTVVFVVVVVARVVVVVAGAGRTQQFIGSGPTA